MGSEASDLGIEFFELLLVGCLLRMGFAFHFEESGQPCNSRGFPGADLVGMDVVLGSDLSNGLLFLERFEDDFSFDSGRMTFSHGVLSLTYFCPFRCLNFLGHYTASYTGRAA